jgi:hypothetical protein
MRKGKGLHSDDWASDFHRVYDRAVAKYRAGIRQASELFDRAESEFLSAIGCSAQEVYDFAEDWCRAGEPSPETVLLITSVRRDYFLYVQKGIPSGHVISLEGLPPKNAELNGYAWLPRIIVKARAKLRGEMPPQLMYGCGGDRPFLRQINVHPADFLREVWATGEDDERIVRFVERCVSWDRQPVGAG